ncbi:MAG: diguanylate cyclase [Deltaproteobacteria bacterium]|jgi:GGDEF domain-containing protein|nr:diguanylate cyclase [Deltaproteobacteria bacterium]
MNHAQTVSGMLITADRSLAERVRALWPEKEFAWIIHRQGAEALEGIMENPPALVLLSPCLPDYNGLEILGLLKGENVYRHVPVLLCLNEEECRAFDPEKDEADDFFILPGEDEEFRRRIRLTVLRTLRGLDTNPLSRLPGNTSIIHEMQRRIDGKIDFSMCYCDLDHFKAFNDKYGFARGDEVLLMTARVILNSVRMLSPQDCFVGHVGGDDFVFALPSHVVEDACRRIVEAFDSIVPGFYDDEDRLRGSIVSKDRQGNGCVFPLMSISMAVVSNNNGRLEHVGQASAIASGLKKKAKESAGSCYVIDQRRD